MNLEEIKRKELLILKKDHMLALKEFLETQTERKARMEEALIIHVTCMDERNRFAVDATGEPYGSVELFASPGGCFTQDKDPVNGAKKFLEIYGKKIEQAKKDGRKVIVYLMPHTCFADNYAGCSIFMNNEEATYSYFSALADELKKLSEMDEVIIHTSMYDTDTHELVPFHGDTMLTAFNQATDYLQREKGMASNAEIDEWDRFNAGYRIYIGSSPLAWNPRRNVAYYLHNKITKEELLKSIALAIKIIKIHSHADLDEHVVVLHLDYVYGDDVDLNMDDIQLIDRLNQSIELKEANIELSKDNLLIVRTETNPNTWEGQIIKTSLDSA